MRKVTEKWVMTMLILSFGWWVSRMSLPAWEREFMSFWQTHVSPGTRFDSFVPEKNKQSWSRLISDRAKIHSSTAEPSWAENKCCRGSTHCTEWTPVFFTWSVSHKIHKIMMMRHWFTVLYSKPSDTDWYSIEAHFCVLYWYNYIYTECPNLFVGF